MYYLTDFTTPLAQENFLKISQDLNFCQDLNKSSTECLPLFDAEKNSRIARKENYRGTSVASP